MRATNSAHSRESGNPWEPLRPPPSRGRGEIWKLKPDVLQLPAGAGTSGRWALRGSAFLDPVFFVAAAAVILADGAERGLEAVEVVHFGDGVLGVGAELGEPRFEVIDIFSDLRIGCGVAAGLGIVGEQRRRLGGGILEGGEDLARLLDIERRFTLGHRCADLGLVAIGLHQRLARGDRILLRESGAGTQGDNGDGGHGPENRQPPLSPLHRAGCAAPCIRTYNCAGRIGAKARPPEITKPYRGSSV